jgi:hypothetical protein
VKLKEFARSLKTNGLGELLTFRETPNLPVETYLEELANHRYVLCPEGNGLDCYRIWEAIYLGVTPILKDSTFARLLSKMGLPVLIVSDWEYIRHSYEAVWQTIDLHRSGIMDTGSNQAATLSYWKREMMNAITT